MRFLYLFLCSLLIFCSCGGSDTSLMGGSTETIGTVVDSLGNPLVGVSVVLVKDNFDSSLDEVPFDTLLTDSAGEYNFLTIDDGAYNLLISNNGNKAFRRSVVVSKGELEESITDTVRQTGSLSGLIQHQHGNNHHGIYLIFLGTGRYTSTVDSVGTFSVDSLASGEYRVKIFTDSLFYEAVEKTLIVLPGVHAMLEDPIELAYIGVAQPQNFDAQYDTLLQEIELSWDKVESDSLWGYYIYRKIEGESDYTLLCDSLLKVPSFTDRELLSLESDKVCYRVHAIHKNGLSGKCSEVVTALLGENYAEVTEFSPPFQLSGTLNSAEMSSSGALWMASSGKSCVYLVDPNAGALTNSITLPGAARPFDMTELQDSTLLVSTNRGLYHLGTDGEVKHWYGGIDALFITAQNETSIAYSAKTDFSQVENSLFFFNPLTGSDTLFSTFEERIEDVVMHDGYLYILLSNYGELRLVRSPFAHYKPEIIYTEQDIKGGFCLSANSFGVFLLSNSVVTVFKNGTPLCRTKVVPRSETLVAMEGSTFCVKDRDDTIIIYKSTLLSSHTIEERE